MKLSQLPPLNFRQRVAVLVGGLALLACVLYPEVETSYYMWMNYSIYRAAGSGLADPLGIRDAPATGYWQQARSTTHREFILDARHGEIVHPDLWVDPITKEIPGLIERRSTIKFLNVLVQGLAVILVTAGAVWATLTA